MTPPPTQCPCGINPIDCEYHRPQGETLVIAYPESMREELERMQRKIRDQHCHGPNGFCSCPECKAKQ